MHAKAFGVHEALDIVLGRPRQLGARLMAQKVILIFLCPNFSSSEASADAPASHGKQLWGPLAFAPQPGEGKAARRAAAATPLGLRARLSNAPSGPLRLEDKAAVRTEVAVRPPAPLLGLLFVSGGGGLYTARASPAFSTS
jgi:hypothetical protein